MILGRVSKTEVLMIFHVVQLCVSFFLFSSSSQVTPEKKKRTQHLYFPFILEMTLTCKGKDGEDEEEGHSTE
jgi:hypothetical protein